MKHLRLTLLGLGLLGAVACVFDGQDQGAYDPAAYAAQVQAQLGHPATLERQQALFLAWQQAQLLAAQRQAGGAGFGGLGYAGGGYVGGDGGSFHANPLLGTAVSTSGDSGYIALGDGNFVSW